ncbi:hypothetical protein [uncultured Prevotella sp.]|uniref:hypothetical protein n=1 Tax=uncultured Prevotella sp. TaxID=159272 RepID=UPI00258C05F3|nr:hypothetical protein [uncultured Prevotella sp.]
MNTQENNILEEMRRQMAILQAKLDKETIINDRLLRESMKNNYSSINRYLNLQSNVLLPIVLVGYPIIAGVFSLSWKPTIAMCVLCIIIMIFDRRVYRIKDEEFMADDLIPTALRLQRALRLSSIEMMVTMPLTFVLFIWFLVDFYQNIDFQSEILTSAAWGGLIGSCVGLVVGIIYAVKIFRSQQRTFKQVLDQINDLVAAKDD